MNDFRELCEAFMNEAGSLAEQLRQAAQTLQAGHLPSAVFEQNTQAALERIQEDSANCVAAYNALAKQTGMLSWGGKERVSIQTLLENYESNADEIALQERRAIREVLADICRVESGNPIYKEAISPLVREAADIQQQLAVLEADALPDVPQEHRKIAAQARAVVDALREVQETGTTRSDEQFRELGIASEILVGILLGQYTLAPKPATETEGEPVGDAAGPDDERQVVRPVGKLTHRAPSAKVFLRAILKLKPQFVELVLTSLVGLDSATVDQMCRHASLGRTTGDRFREDVWDTAEALWSSGILAKYELSRDDPVYMISEFGIQSLLKQAVHKQVCTRVPASVLRAVGVAKEEMSTEALVAQWVTNETRIRYSTWKCGTTRGEPHQEMRTRLNPTLGREEDLVRLPAAAGRVVCRLETYEYALKTDSPDPVLYVVVMGDTDPIADNANREFSENDLLLWNNILYERQNEAWAPREIREG